MNDSNLPPNPGVDYFFSTVNRIFRLAGFFGKKLVHYEIQKRGLVNWDFQDEKSCTQWHFILDTDNVSICRGFLKNADSTIQMKPATFHALLLNKTDFITARLTGRIRMAGDPNYVVLVSYFVKNFHKSRQATGLKGFFRRRFADKVLKKFEKD